MVLCCAVGPAVIGAVAGLAIGGWVGLSAPLSSRHASVSSSALEAAGAAAPAERATGVRIATMIA